MKISRVDHVQETINSDNTNAAEDVESQGFLFSAGVGTQTCAATLEDLGGF